MSLFNKAYGATALMCMVLSRRNHKPLRIVTALRTHAVTFKVDQSRRGRGLIIGGDPVANSTGAAATSTTAAAAITTATAHTEMRRCRMRWRRTLYRFLTNHI